VNGSVIDTNVITKLLANDPVAERMVRNAGKLYAPAIVVGELYFAAVNSSRCEANLEVFRKALSCMELIPIDGTVCMSYAEIKTGLKKKGRPIPDNDIWIAACAIANDLSVASFDNHFLEVSGLRLIGAE